MLVMAARPRCAAKRARDARAGQRAVAIGSLSPSEEYEEQAAATQEEEEYSRGDDVEIELDDDHIIRP